MDAMIKERVKHKKSNPCYATMVKLILNSFYGKTIAKDPQSAYVVSNSEEKFHKYYNYESLLMNTPIKITEKSILARIDCRKLDDFQVYKTQSGQIKKLSKPQSTPTIFGSFLLAYSRQQMNKFITAIDGWKQSKVYYQDTDSLYIHQKDIQLLKDAGCYHDANPFCGKNDLKDDVKIQ